MKIPNWLRIWLLAWAQQVMKERGPDEILHTREGYKYLGRWWITWHRRWMPRLYLHHIVRSDDDRALHDHPSFNISILLDGTYAEILGDPVVMGFDKFIPHRIFTAGDVVFRSPWLAHRLVVTPGRTTTSLWFVGPKVRAWGVLCQGGWRHWEFFTSKALGTNTSRGCD